MFCRTFTVLAYIPLFFSESTSFLQSEGLMMNDDSGDSSSSVFSEGTGIIS